MTKIKKRYFLDCFLDKITHQIINVTQDTSKSIRDLSEELNISKSVVYRKIQTLNKLGLFKITGDFDKNDKKVFSYQSKIKSFNLRYAEDSLHLYLKPSENTILFEVPLAIQKNSFFFGPTSSPQIGYKDGPMGTHLPFWG